MHYNYYWWGGMGFIPFVLIILAIVALYFILSSRRLEERRKLPDERERTEGTANRAALDILKKRYAQGEITKEQFEEMKNDILQVDSEADKLGRFF